MITDLPSEWYGRINRATTLISIVVAVSYFVIEYLWAPLGDNSLYGLELPAGILAAIHGLYGLIVFRFLSRKNPRAAGIITFVLFVLMAATLIHTTRELSTQYVGTWTIVTLISGMFGWFVLSAITLLTTGYFWAIAEGVFSGATDFNLTLVSFHIVAAAVSLVLWHNVAKEGSPSTSRRATIDEAGSIKNAINAEVIISSIADGVLITDDKGVIRVFNTPAQNITGWPTEEAVGLNYKSVFMLTDEKNKELGEQNNPIYRAMHEGKPISDSTSKLQTKSKKTSELDILASPLKSDSTGSTLGVLVIFRDISKRRSEERQRAEFISTASHEMRTPVAAIEGYLALAMNDRVSKIDSAARGYLEKAHASTQHLGKLFQDLLTAAKSEDGRLTNHPTAVEVGSFLDEIIEGVRFTAEKKGLIMEADFSDGHANATASAGPGVVRPVAYVHVDPERIREVITNLFDNAVKYTEEGKITIGMRTSQDKVTITVSDTGAGIPKEDIPHLFQKFYRVDNSATRQVGGTGLGLFICRKIVELYNGRIWVESEAGQGSTFLIELPRISADQAQSIQAKEEANKSLLPEQEKAANEPTPVPAASSNQPQPTAAPPPQPQSNTAQPENTAQEQQK